MLNFISLSMCGVLSSSVVFTAAIPVQPSPASSSLDDSTHLTSLTQEGIEKPIHFADADGGSGDGDSRGAGRRN